MLEIKELLSEDDIERIVLHKEPIRLSPEVKQSIEKCYDFLKSFSEQKIIYGYNTPQNLDTRIVIRKRKFIFAAKSD